MKYRRVDSEDRMDIAIFRDQGLNQKQIARRTGFHPSTISREIRRNRRPRDYHPGYANWKKWQREAHRRKPKKMTEGMQTRIQEYLAMYWSPEQISNKMKEDCVDSVSPETIYRYIYKDRKNGGTLYFFLRMGRKKRKHRFPKRRPHRSFVLPSIENRPVEANERSRIGDWERDTVFGTSRKESLLVIVDRKPRLTKLARLKTKKPSETNAATLRVLSGLPQYTITNDRGFEFMQHDDLEKQTSAKIYYCHAYSSSERGTNENTNGLIRQFFPKRTSLQDLSDEDLQKIEDLLNNRPRKCLDWKTPAEEFLRHRIALCG